MNINNITENDEYVMVDFDLDASIPADKKILDKMKQGKLSKEDLLKYIKNRDKSAHTNIERNEVNKFLEMGKQMVDCPIYEPDFKNKRYDKFVEKMNKFMSELMNRTTDLSYMTIYHVGVQIVLDKLVFEMEDETKLNCTTHKYDVYNLIAPNYLFKKLCEQPLFLKYAKNRALAYVYDTNYDNEFLDIAKKDFTKVVDYWLVIKYLDIRDRERFMMGYTSYMPTTEEGHLLFRYYLNLLYNDILLLLSLYEKETIEEAMNKVENHYKEQLAMAHENIQQLKIELEEQQNKAKDFLPTMKRLKEEAENGTKDQQTMFDCCIVEKNREIKTLEKQIQNLKDNIAYLMTKVPEEEVQLTIEPQKECDTTLKYTFAMVETPDLEEQLLSAFPNSTIAHTSEEFNTNTDCVVFMTKRLKHNMYYKVKNICKTRDIPFLHYSSLDIDRLKNEIARIL